MPSRIKLGLEFFVANGPAGVASVRAEGASILDLKLHDIQYSAGQFARRSAEALLLTVHAGGLPECCAAADAAAAGGSGRPL